jgi:UDP-N-acetylglucosamine--N-acetylmuramyl-(pentapeptide) pyrophosphoryl-undecaprenol N-acetylglucosamine transferase
VFPALAVAGALVAAGHEADSIHYVGCVRGIETRLLPETPYPHTFFDVVGFQRSVSRRNLAFVPKMWRARRDAIALLRALEPSVVVSVGGYASMPAVFAARKLGVPVVVVSYDLVPGRASRLSARRAAACAVAFENSPLPHATVTGAPVRQEILTLDRAAARGEALRRLEIPEDRFLVAVMGGSLGSGVLNGAIAAYASDRRDDPGLAIRQVAGERFVGEIDVVHPSGSAGLLHQVVGFEDDMASVYAAADLLVGRGGASTVHEVAVTGVPAILVPWSGAADDHQTENVRWLSDAHGAVLMSERDMASDVSRLGATIERLRSDESARRELSDAARARGEVHRSGALASLIERVALASTPR